MNLINISLGSKRVCVPYVHDDAGSMSPGLIKKFTDLTEGRFSIMEPIKLIEVPIDTVDLVIVPGIAFDYNGDGLPDDKDDVPTIKHDKPLAVPSHFYKIVIRNLPDGTIDAIAIITPHDVPRRNKSNSLNYIQNQCLNSIDAIERISGFNFRWGLDNQAEDDLELNVEEVRMK